MVLHPNKVEHAEHRMIIARLGIQAAPESDEQAIRVIRPVLGPIRAESGCIACDLFQRVDDNTRLVLMEQWESQPDLERHIRSDHYRQILAWIEMSVETPEIHFDTVTGSGGLEMIEMLRGVR